MTRTSPDLARAGNDNAVAEDDLQAYVDGHLDGRRRAVIESYLASHPQDAQRLAAYRAQNIGLHALFDRPPGSPLREDKLPPRIAALAGALQAQLNEPPQAAAVSRRLRNLAASLALLAAAGTAGWLTLSEPPASPGLQTAAAPQASLPPSVAAEKASATGNPREVTAWLAAQSGNVPTTVPRLESLGFELTGEDVVESEFGPAARLHYQDGHGQRVTLTMRAVRKTGDSGAAFFGGSETSRLVWQDAQMAYSLAGALAQEKLQQIADAITRSLRADQPIAAQAAGPATGATAGKAPVEPAAPVEKPAPAIEKIPLIPVPLPDADSPKET